MSTLRIFALVATLLLALLAIACRAPEATGVMPRPDTFPRDVSGINFLHPPSSGAMFEYEVPTLEEVLEFGLYGAGASPTHIVAQGTAVANSARCSWQTTVRTNAQREAAVKFMLSLDEDAELPSAEHLRAAFDAYAYAIAPQYRDAMKANFNHLIDGGAFDDGRVLACYADYSTSVYLLGSGADTLTVTYGQSNTTRSYNLYVKEHARGLYGDASLMTKDNYLKQNDAVLALAETELVDALKDRQAVLFLTPMAAHGNVATEAWQVVAQWDIQTLDDVEYAVRYGTHEGDAEHIETLSNLKTRVAAAAASDSHAGKRIANTSDLNRHYRDMGAYNDITPNDGETTTFTPSPPPLVPACASGGAVSNPANNRLLVRDCSALIEAHDKLRGSAPRLNWARNLHISNWLGVVRGGTPERVTAIYLERNALGGIIPDELFSLTGLKILDLSNNALIGEIPAGLADLPLTTLELSNNRFTGCIPGALREIQTHDLDRLGLLYCDAAAPDRIGDLRSSAISASDVDLIWTTPAHNHAPITGYRLQQREADSEFGDVTPAPEVNAKNYAVQNLKPNTVYEYRLLAVNGIGEAEWSNVFALQTLATSPGQVTDFQGSTFGQTSVMMQWSEPSEDGGSPVTGYRLQRQSTFDQPVQWDDVSSTLGANQLSYTDTGLQTGNAYVYRVKARNKVGEAATWSQEITLQPRLLAPAALGNLSTQLENNSVINLYWELPPADDNPRSGIQLQRKLGSGAFVDVSPAPGVNATGYRDTNTVPGNDHTYRVRATNHAGHSDWSKEISIRILAQTPVPAGLGVSLSSGTFTVSWDADTNFASREVQYRASQSDEWATLAPVSADAATFTPGNLPTCADAYAFRVRARGNGVYYTAEWSEFSAPVAYQWIAVFQAADFPGLVRDCTILLANKSTLEGTTGSLNWGLERNMGAWDGLGFERDIDGVERINLSNQGLSGSLPKGFSGLINLDRLNLQGNQLTGSIPVEIGTMENLRLLYLHNNRLTGSIPADLGNMDALEALFLSNNELSGSIPSELGQLLELDFLILSGNNLTGAIPDELGNLTELEILQLSHNQLSGSIPATLANPPGLHTLLVKVNSFTGCIPQALLQITTNDLSITGLPTCQPSTQ